MMAEISYSRQNTSVALNTYPAGVKEDLFDLAIEYIQAGALYEQPYAQGRMKPFGSFSLGATRFAPNVVELQPKEISNGLKNDQRILS
jgi:hypothetical protein